MLLPPFYLMEQVTIINFGYEQHHLVFTAFQLCCEHLSLNVKRLRVSLNRVSPQSAALIHKKVHLKSRYIRIYAVKEKMRTKIFVLL